MRRDGYWVMRRLNYIDGTHSIHDRGMTLHAISIIRYYVRTASRQVVDSFESTPTQRSEIGAVDADFSATRAIFTSRVTGVRVHVEHLAHGKRAGDR